MNPSVSFAIPLNADVLTVNGVVDSIHKFFGINAAPGVSPTTLVPAAPQGPLGDNNDDDAGSANANAPTADKNGMPWDSRIHSSSKALNADGTWRYRKGVDAATKTKVEGEIRATLNAGTVTTPAAAQTTTVNAAPSLPTPPGALPSMPPLPGANVETPFTRFVKFLAENTQSPENPSGRLTTDWVKAALTNYGVANGDMQNLAHAAAEVVNNIENGIRTALGLPNV